MMRRRTDKHMRTQSACIWRSAWIKCADVREYVVPWDPTAKNGGRIFLTQQAIPMVWDFAEQIVFREHRRSSCEVYHIVARRSINFAPQPCAVLLRKLTRRRESARAEDPLSHRSAILRQHRLRRFVGLLLRLASRSLQAGLPRSVRDTSRSQRPKNWSQRPTATAVRRRRRSSFLMA